MMLQELPRISPYDNPDLQNRFNHLKATINHQPNQNQLLPPPCLHNKDTLSTIEPAIEEWASQLAVALLQKDANTQHLTTLTKLHQQIISSPTNQTPDTDPNHISPNVSNILIPEALLPIPKKWRMIPGHEIQTNPNLLQNWLTMQHNIFLNGLLNSIQDNAEKLLFLLPTTLTIEQLTTDFASDCHYFHRKLIIALNNILLNQQIPLTTTRFPPGTNHSFPELNLNILNSVNKYCLNTLPSRILKNIIHTNAVQKRQTLNKIIKTSSRPGIHIPADTTSQAQITVLQKLENLPKQNELDPNLHTTHSLNNIRSNAFRRPPQTQTTNRNEPPRNTLISMLTTNDSDKQPSKDTTPYMDTDDTTTSDNHNIPHKPTNRHTTIGSTLQHIQSHTYNDTNDNHPHHDNPLPGHHNRTQPTAHNHSHSHRDLTKPPSPTQQKLNNTIIITSAPHNEGIPDLSIQDISTLFRRYPHDPNSIVICPKYNGPEPTGGSTARITLNNKQTTLQAISNLNHTTLHNTHLRVEQCRHWLCQICNTNDHQNNNCHLLPTDDHNSHRHSHQHSHQHSHTPHQQHRKTLYPPQITNHPTSYHTPQKSRTTRTQDPDRTPHHRTPHHMTTKTSHKF
jgi:hypothetical protein